MQVKVGKTITYVDASVSGVLPFSYRESER
jgi:hypothetical protein